MQEQRKFVRFNIPSSLETSFCNPDRVKGFVKDISMKGVKIVVDGSPDILTEAVKLFHFLLPDKTLEISGEVVWQREYSNRKEFGVRFKDAPDSHKEEIYNYIFRHHQQELIQKWWKN